MTKKKTIIIIAVATTIALLSVYGVHIVKTDTFPENSVINGTEIGNMTADEAEIALTDTANKIKVRNDNEDPKNIKLAFEYERHHLKKLIKLAAANPLTARKLKLGEVNMDMKVKDGAKESAKILSQSELSDEDSDSKDAYIDFEKMSIVKEEYGNKLDYDKLTKDIAIYIEQGKPGGTFKFKGEDYIKLPAVYATDEDLLDELKFYKKYIGQGLNLIYPDGSAVFVGPEKLKKIVDYVDGEPKFSEKEAEKLVAEYKNYTPASCTVKTLNGDKSLANYVLSAPVNTDEAKTLVLEALRDFKTEIQLSSMDSIDLPDTRVEINLSSQTCTFVRDGKKKFSCNIVSGTNGHRTPEGIFEVSYKERNVDLKGENDDGSKYSSHVDYWMPFNGGIGLHDADWRSSFGGDIYVYNGSHGCVNMPPKYAKKLYNSIGAGTVVIVYS